MFECNDEDSRAGISDEVAIVASDVPARNWESNGRSLGMTMPEGRGDGQISGIAPRSWAENCEGIADDWISLLVDVVGVTDGPGDIFVLADRSRAGEAL